MEAYEFTTTITDNGVIKIPEISMYKNREVKIIVMFQKQDDFPEHEIKKKSIDEFFEKWSGKFSKIETDDIRYNALMEKHG